MGRVARSVVLAFGCVIAGAIGSHTAGCGGDSGGGGGGADASAGITSGTWRGVMAGGGGESGTIQLNIPMGGASTSSLHILSPVALTVSGTINVSTFVGPITLSGTVSLDTGAIDFTTNIGGYSFHGTLANGVLTGTYTGGGGGAFVHTYDQLGGLRVFCGAFRSSPGRVGPAVSGVFDMFAVGTTVGAVYSSSTGATGSFAGHATNLHIDLGWPNGAASGDIDATGKLTGQWNDAMSGGPLGASEVACLALGATGDGGAEGGLTDGAANDGNVTDGASEGSTNNDGGGGLTRIASISNHRILHASYNGTTVYFTDDSPTGTIWSTKGDGTQTTPTNFYQSPGNYSFYGLTTTATDIFFIDPHYLYAISIQGGPPAQQSQTMLSGPSEITTDATNVYVMEYGASGAIHKLAQSSLAQQGTYASQPYASGLAIDGSTLYWGTVANIAQNTGRAINSASTSMQGTINVVIPDADFGLAQSTSVPGLSLIDGANLFAYVYPAPTNGSALMRPKDGSGTTQVSTRPLAFNGDATYLYFVDAQSNLVRVPRSNPTASPTVVTAVAANLRVFGADATAVYMQGMSEIWRYAL